MEKININRLLRVFVPFIIMVMIQNVLLLLFGKLGFGGNIPNLAAFLGGSMAAIFLFYLYNYGNGAEDWSGLTKNPVVRDFMYLFFTLSAMILAMYLVSAIISDYSSESISVTPLYIVSVLLMHPLLEEYIFRGLFYGELRKINPIFGITAQAIMFAIIHSTVDGMIYALISGVLLGFVMEKTKRLIVPIVAHICINTRSLLYLTALAGKDSLRDIIDTVFVSVGVVSILILIFTRGRNAMSLETAEPNQTVVVEENADD